MKNEFSFKNVGGDLSAGLVVFLVALPLCLGISLASEAPLFSGIIAGIVGGVVVGAISGSKLGVSGPAAGLAVIVASAINEFEIYEIFLASVVIGGFIQLILGFVGAGKTSLETLLCVEATDRLDPNKNVTPTNRELVAQGAGNMLSGLIGGIPVTQVIVRSSANIQAGGKTKMSAVFHGILLLVCVMFIPNLLNMIPLSALAAVLIIVGYKLAKPEMFKRMYSEGHDQFIPFIVTIVAVLFTDLLVGILIGLMVGIGYVLYTNFKSVIKPSKKGNHTVIDFQKDVFFYNGELVKNLSILQEGDELTLDGRNIDLLIMIFS
ncbi:UNVERIFIED_CONTAM: hypothetical protein GTU68_062343 [Idotea baltica]|nr:hypothetical protein [Idotea baltica]